MTALLLVEEEPKQTSLLQRSLERAGVSVSTTTPMDCRLTPDMRWPPTVLLASTQLFSLYLGFAAERAGARVLPSPRLAKQLGHAVERTLLARRAGMETPELLVGEAEELRVRLSSEPEPPWMLPRLRGSEPPRRLKVTDALGGSAVYAVQRQVPGTRLVLDFVGRRARLRSPHPPERVPTDLARVLERWRGLTGAPWGALHLTRRHRDGGLTFTHAELLPDLRGWPRAADLIAERVMAAPPDN